MRIDGRQVAELRRVSIVPGFTRQATGSVLIEAGATRVICTASVEDNVPQFLRNPGRGWVTAEYGMLPGSSRPRIQREASRGRPDGRTQEIQRLIGRSLRAVTDMSTFGERTIWVDCDVIQADGGTRTASITGAYVALALAFRELTRLGCVNGTPFTGSVAAVSCGMVDGEAMLDLCYEEDSKAEVDMNFVMTGDGRYIEVQGTAESKPFGKKDLDRLAELAHSGIEKLTLLQREALG
jgi:ribonuclease PH